MTGAQKKDASSPPMGATTYWSQEAAAGDSQILTRGAGDAPSDKQLPFPFPHFSPQGCDQRLNNL